MESTGTTTASDAYFAGHWTVSLKIKPHCFEQQAATYFTKLSLKKK